MISTDPKRKMIGGDRVVISGISGTFPECNNVKEFSEILYNRVNPVTPLDNYISFKHPEIPLYSGKLPNLETFDAQFFKVNYRLGKSVDAIMRKIMEHTYQAIFDAGTNLEYFSNRKVGIYVSSSMAESEKHVLYNNKAVTGLALLGSSKTMFANRLSYWLNTTGPSFNMDSSSCSSMAALEQAWRAIANGECDAAIVVGCYIMLHPQTLVVNGRSITLTMSNRTQSFDQNADGCVMSDAINVFLLQREKDALRVYAEVEKIKCEFSLISNDKKQYNRFTSEDISKFLETFYKEANVSPNSVEFMEAFGIAEPEFDKAELEAIDKVFCKNRNDHLSVGSVISNVGYTEAASSLTALTKVILAYQEGKIAANLHYKDPLSDISAIRQGRLRIVTNHEPFNRTYAAVNNFSFPGHIGHALLKGNFKPKDLKRYKSNIPYLVLLSGRIESSVQEIIEYLKSRPLDAEEIALLHKFYQHNISGHLGRGYVIIDTVDDITLCKGESVSYFDHQERPLWFVYSGMGSQWAGMGAQLMLIPTFAAAIERCRVVLEPKGVDIVKIITSPDKTIFDNILNSFLGIAAIQIGLTDILRELGIKPDGIIGHSLGELGCGYADGCLTAEEMILSAYSRGYISLETSFIRGSMAAVGIGYQEMIKLLPPEIEIACHNSTNSCTLSGPSDAIEEMIQKLTSKSIFAKEVPCSNIAYHSRYIADAGPALLQYMKEVLPVPKERSSRWLSTSVPQSKWDEPWAKYSSAEYYTNNLLNPVLFEETMRLIPYNAVLIEIAPHGLLQAILKRSLPSSCYSLALTKRGSSDNVRLVLEGIGKIYETGRNPNVAVLYPEVEFPVSTQTPMLSHLVKWVHTELWPLPKFKTAEKVISGTCDLIISTYDDEYRYLEGHIRKGQNLFPFSAALVAVWDTLAMTLNFQRKQLTAEFRDLHFHSQPILLKKYPLRITISIQRGTGRFEVFNEESRIVTGFIIPETIVSQNTLNYIKIDENSKLDSRTVYQLLLEKNLMYKNEFQSIKYVNKTVDTAELIWNNNWVTFIDGLIQLNILRHKINDVEPRLCFIKNMTINVKQHDDSVERLGNHLLANIIDTDDCTRCGGIYIETMKFYNLPLVSQKPEIVLKMTCKKIDNIKNYSASNTDVMLLSDSFDNFDSLSWKQASKLNGPGIDVKVCYAAINQYDVKFAEGSVPSVEKRTINKGHGMDFAGLTANGTRVMGLVESGAVRSHVRVRPELLWPVPNHWSLEDAATVPLAYSLAFYCLVVKYKLYRGVNILVHGGAGALGQAVISIALAHDCEVFTTVSNITKNKFLKRLYPKLKVENIGNSKDTSFVNMVLSATEGKGCDFIINCGNGAVKTESLNCCSGNGIVLDTSLILNCEDFHLGLSFLRRERSFVTLNLLSMFEMENLKDMQKLQAVMTDGISRGYVRPLTRVVFEPQEVSRAFTFISNSRHCGRVLIRLELDHKIIPKKTRIECNPNLWSILIFEEEIYGSLIAERLVERGARKLQLNCPQNSDYLNYKIQLLQEKGVEVEIINIYSNSKLSHIPKKLFGAEVEGVYILQNKQNNERHIASIIEQLVLTQSNIERSLAYFAVINVNSESQINTTDVTQDLASATIVNVPKIITIPDDFNKNSLFISLYDTIDATELAITTRGAEIELYINNNIQKHSLVQEVANIAGMAIPDDVNENATISDLCKNCNKSGAISSYLQNICNMSIPPENIPLLKIKRLQEIDQALNETNKRVPEGLASFFSFQHLDELEAYIEILLLPTLTNKDVNDSEIDVEKKYLFVIPGIEGHYTRFRDICERLKIGAIVLKPMFDDSFMTTSEQAQKYAKLLIDKLKITDSFYLLGYEYGVPIALEVAAILEDHGLQGTVFCVGHTITDLRLEVVKVLSTFKDETEVREAVINEILYQLKGNEITLPASKELDWKKRLESFLRSPVCRMPYSTQYLLELVEGTFNRLLQARDVVVKQISLKSQLVLIKASSTNYSDNSISSLQCYSQKPVAVYDLETPLVLICKDPRCATIINEHLSPDIRKAYSEMNICYAYVISNLLLDMD